MVDERRKDVEKTRKKFQLCQLYVLDAHATLFLVGLPLFGLDYFALWSDRWAIGLFRLHQL